MLARKINPLIQPFRPVRINRASPFARGLKVCYFGNFEYVTRTVPTRTGGAFGIDRYGRYWQSGGSGTELQLSRVKLKYTSDGYDKLTVVALGSFSSADATTAICSYTEAGGGNFGWAFKAEQWADSNQVGFTHHGTAGADVTSGVATPSGYSFLGVSANQAGHQFLINGAASSVVGANLVYSGEASLFRIGATRGGLDPLVSGDRVYAVFVWERDLSLAELRLLRLAPYLLFERPYDQVIAATAGPTAAALTEALSSVSSFGGVAVVPAGLSGVSSFAAAFLGRGIVPAALPGIAIAASAVTALAQAVAGLPGAASAADTRSAVAQVPKSLSEAASATDTRSAVAQAPVGLSGAVSAVSGQATGSTQAVTFTAPLTSNAVADATAAVNAALVSGVSAGETWAKSALVLAELVANGAAGSVIASSSSSAGTRAVMENTPASSAFVNALVALANLVANGDTVAALVAVVVSSMSISNVVTSSSAFSATSTDNALATWTDAATAGGTVAAVAAIVAAFSSVVSSSALAVAQATAPASWSAAGSAGATFSAFSPGAAAYVLAVVQIRALLAASVEVSPAASVSVSIKPN